MTKAFERSSFLYAILFLCGITIAVFGQTLSFEFLNLDDDYYVTKNAFLGSWGTWEGIGQAFTYTGTGNWHPLIWISLMLDHALYGLNPAGYHLTNVLLHLANGLLLFSLLHSWTGSFWRSLFVAALFLVHPQRAESVAWVAERKDVLSGFFFFVTLWFYGRYTNQGQWKHYVAAVAAFGAGLLSKSMLVTVPFLLLLLDYWPLGRFEKANFRKLLIEKVPFFLLIVGSIFMAIQSRTGIALYINEEISFGNRFLNSFVFALSYARDALWPQDLTFYRPYPLRGIPLPWILLSMGILLGILALGWIKKQKAPYLWVGGCWFLGMLTPVIGWVHIGSSAYADRYSYLPIIGFWMIVAWGAQALTHKAKSLKIILRGAAGVLVLVYALLCLRQTALWKNSETLYRYGIQINPQNFIAHVNLGLVLKKSERYEEAIQHFQKARRIRSGDVEPVFYQGATYYEMGNIPKAVNYFEQSFIIDPEYARAHEIMAEIRSDQGNAEEARQHLEALIKAQPHNAQAYYNYGNLWMQKKDFVQAESNYRIAYNIKPDYVKAANNLANVLVMQGRTEEAVELYERVLAIDASHESTRANLILVLNELGRTREAREHERGLRKEGL